MNKPESSLMVLVPKLGEVRATRRPAALIGQSFGRLTVVGTAVDAGGRRVWVCQCSCGNSTTGAACNLKNGNKKSCGCLHKETVKTASLTHGCSGSPGVRTKEYRAWSHIRGRCNNRNDHGFKDYGGRGISVHPAWDESFEAFLADVGLAPSPAHSLDRYPNNDGNYEPGNVRWATSSEQMRNTRRTILVNGLALKDACEVAGVSYGAAQARIRRGQSAEQAIAALGAKQ